MVFLKLGYLALDALAGLGEFFREDRLDLGVELLDLDKLGQVRFGEEFLQALEVGLGGVRAVA